MKRLMIPTLAVVLSLAGAVETSAQNANANANAQGNANSNNGNRDNGNKGNNGQNGRPESPGRSNDLNYGRIISALRNGTAESYADAVGDAEAYRLVLLSSLPGQAASNAQALNNALEAGGQTEESFQATVAESQALTDAIEASGYSVEEIIGWTVRNDDIILIIDDVS